MSVHERRIGKWISFLSRAQAADDAFGGLVGLDRAGIQYRFTAVIGVRTKPGLMTVTPMPWRREAEAQSTRAQWMSAAFDVP